MKYFRLQLMVIISLFTLVLTIVMSLINFNVYKNSLINENNTKQKLIEETVLNSISYVENAYELFDKEENAKLEAYLSDLSAYYDRHPDIANWDYQALKRKYDNIDVYVFDEKNVVKYSSLPGDVGWDASSSPEFFKLLEDGRTSGKFWADAISLEAWSGHMKKYAYVATKDKKYILELGFALDNTEMYKRFNFVDVVGKLKSQYVSVSDIVVFNGDWISYNKLVKNDKGELGPYALDKSRISEVAPLLKDYNKRLTFTKSENNVAYTSLYVASSYSPTNVADHKFVEITYNDKKISEMLTDAKKSFIINMCLTMLVAVSIALIIARIISKPMHLAFHDPLTGIYNRANFERTIGDLVAKNKRKGDKNKFALIGIDLDNFKSVNTVLGHDGGDFLLKDIAQHILAALRNSTSLNNALSSKESADLLFRLGGDEFVVLIINIKDDQVPVAVAQRILFELRGPIVVKGVDVVAELNVSASLGIAIFPDHAEDADLLYKKADIALYHAKDAGKSTYRVYDDTMTKNE